MSSNLPIDSANQMLEGQLFVLKSGEVLIIYDKHLGAHVKTCTVSIVVLRLRPAINDAKSFYAWQELMPCWKVDDLLKDAIRGEIVPKKKS